jgi:hypothetical protein
MVFQSIARLQQASNAAVSARSRSMLDPDARTSSRVHAADMVLDRELKVTNFVPRIYELQDLDQGDRGTGSIVSRRVADSSWEAPSPK